MAANAMLDKISSGDISTTGRPIHFMFYSRVGFSGDGGSNGAIFDSNKFKMAAAAILDNFEWPYLRNGSRSTYAVVFALAQLSCCCCIHNNYCLWFSAF